MTEETIDDDLMNVIDKNYAGFGIRLLAYIIDAVIFTFVAYLIWGDEVVSTYNGGFSIQLNNEKLLIPLAYFLLSWTFLSASLGKIALGLKIVDSKGEKIIFQTALLRIIGYVILIIGCWFILGNDKKQALHDKIAQTFVVKK